MDIEGFRDSGIEKPELQRSEIRGQIKTVENVKVVQIVEVVKTVKTSTSFSPALAEAATRRQVLSPFRLS